MTLDLYSRMQLAGFNRSKETFISVTTAHSRAGPSACWVAIERGEEEAVHEA